MDLCEEEASPKVQICPDCTHELVRIVCLGASLRVCTGCRGFWFPFSVVQEFSKNQELFKHLKSAASLLSDAHVR
jgi:hypothetical protein